MMIFKNINNSQVANIVSPNLIEEYLKDPNWIVGSESDLPKDRPHEGSYTSIA